MLSARISRVKDDFLACSDWEDRYLKLIEYGKKLPPLPDTGRSEDFRIKGCQSQVWLYPELKNEKVILYADSDALLVKGIVALLLEVYSGASPDEILKTPDHFLKEMGITEHLSMNRSNGLAAMVKQLKLYAIAFQTVVNSEKGAKL